MSVRSARDRAPDDSGPRNRWARIALATTVVAGFAGAAPGVASAAPTPAPYVVSLVESQDDVALSTGRLERAFGFSSSDVYVHALRGFAAPLTPGQIEKLKDHPAVSSVVPDVEISSAGKPGASAPVAAEQLPVGVKRIGAEGKGAASSAVAVLDTGLDLANRDLNASHGINCVKDGKPAQDDDGHGTHVGGTIAARADGGGVIGVAPGTRLYAVKVLDSSAKGRLSGLLCGMEWVRANAERLDIRVANASITAPGSDDGACGARDGSPLHAAICSSVAAGIVYVAATGNASQDFARTAPAAYGEVLAVTAATDTDGREGGIGGAACEAGERDDRSGTYSNFATTDAAAAHTLAAPGTCVVSSKIGGGVTTMLGTSMAAPHVAAAAALCIGTGDGAGPCATSDPALLAANVTRQLQADAAQRSGEGFGFLGDPLSILNGRHMGHLVSALDY